MDINFSDDTPEGTVDFTGTLSKDEVDFLLRFALLSLLQRGMMPASIIATLDKGEAEEEDIVPVRKDLN